MSVGGGEGEGDLGDWGDPASKQERLLCDDVLSPFMDASIIFVTHQMKIHMPMQYKLCLSLLH